MTMRNIISKANIIISLLILLEGKVFPTFGNDYPTTKSSYEYCCQKKIVNGKTYIRTYQSGIYPDPTCNNDCIYYEEDDPSKFVCFRNGPYQPECIPDCQEGWEYFEHTKTCYKRFTHSSSVNWMDAQYDCRQHGGNLAIIHDEETNTFVNGIAGGSMAWIGAFRVGPLVDPRPLNSQWTWNDGSPLDYSNWVSNQPDNKGGDEFCGHINRLDTVGLWNDVPCNSTLMEDFVCQSKVYSPISGFYCPDGWIQFGTKGKCYKAFFGSSIITWMDAQKSCRFQGGDLAVIHDEETNIFVNDIADGTRAWIGAFRVGPIPYQNDEFSWIDGSAMDFDAWAVDQPDNYGGDEFCVHINLVENSADWNDYDCWSATNSDVLITNFVCQF